MTRLAHQGDQKRQPREDEKIGVARQLRSRPGGCEEKVVKDENRKHDGQQTGAAAAEPHCCRNVDDKEESLEIERLERKRRSKCDYDGENSVSVSHQSWSQGVLHHALRIVTSVDSLPPRIGGLPSICKRPR